MDTESEASLIDRITPEIEGRTLLLITHRMSLLRFVNRIVLMRDGKILADGPRDEILRRMNPSKAA
jgi:ATP-binding cassette subfamily C protein LapB